MSGDPGALEILRGGVWEGTLAVYLMGVSHLKVATSILTAYWVASLRCYHSWCDRTVDPPTGSVIIGWGVALFSWAIPKPP